MRNLTNYTANGLPVRKLYETSIHRCPNCGRDTAIEQGDPYTGLSVRCVECDVQMRELSDDELAPWQTVDADAYAHLNQRDTNE